MKNNIKKYLSIIILLVFTLTTFSCFEDEEFASDVSKVVPTIFDLKGPSLTFQSSTATYSVASRGGSEYFWTVNNGAEIQPIEGRKDMINVYFNQSGTVSISVYEQVANGQTSEADEIEVEVVCNPQSGVYRVVMHDSYGDGWQTENGDGGGGITIDIDGTIVEIGMCSPYLSSNFDCVTGDYNDAETTVTIPAGTISASWNFPGDYWGEISFEIYAPDGSLAFASGAPGETEEGQLPIVICN